MGQFLEQYRELIERTRDMDGGKTGKTVPDTIQHLNYRDIVVRFDHVSFCYPNSNKKVLKDINLVLKTNRSLSIVGLNGAGKTTLVKLLCRFYEPTEGRIYLNDTDISSIPIDEYHKLLGVVFQDYRLFPFSVLENIALVPPYDEDRTWKVLEKCGLREKVEKLNNKLQTAMSKDLDEKGVEFSGGESQRVELARVLYKDPPIVILDEPTASLDPLTEYGMYQDMHTLTLDKCTVFISHRLPSTRFTDDIVVLKEGGILEYGTFDELMGKENGYFHSLYEMQSIYYQKGI